MKTELVRTYSSLSVTSFSKSTETLDQSLDDFGSKSGILSKICTPKNIKKKFPFVTWLPSYSVDKLVADFIAGITVGLTILPQALAYAQVAGIPPQYGLYSAIIGCFVYIALGSTAEIAMGPTAVLAIITFTYTRGKPVEYAVVLCLLTGIVTFLMGVFQLGFIVNFISTPVNSGFTSAAAITICSTQLRALLGLTFKADGVVNIVAGTVNHITEVKAGDALLSLICSIILLVLMKLQVICKCMPNSWFQKTLWFLSTSRNAIVVIGSSIVAAAMGSANPFTVVGHIEPGLPPFAPPPMSITVNGTTHSFLHILQEEGSAIIVIPLLAIMEHITIAKAFTQNLDASQEMIAIGISNILGSFVGSMPICGSFSRSTVNAMSGARSPLGGLVTGSMVVLSLAFLTPYFYFIPKASLASVLVCAMIFMIDFSVIIPMWRSKKMDFIPWGATFLMSMFLGLEFGMMCGFVISVIYLLYYSARPGVKIIKGITQKGNQFVVVQLDRSLTFPCVEYIRYVVNKSSRMFEDKYPVAIDCHHIQFADFTAAKGMCALMDEFNKRGQLLVMWKAKPSLQRILSGVLPDLKRDSILYFSQGEKQLELMIDTKCQNQKDAGLYLQD